MKNKHYYTVLPYSYYRKNRKYANGSFMAAQDRAMKENFSNGAGFSSVMGMLGGVSDIIKSGVDNAQIADTTGLENSMENMGKNVEASSLDSLMEQWGTTSNIGNQYSWRDVRGKTDGELAGSILGSGLSGAAAGASAGPIGAIVGGAIGLIGSGIGAAVGRNKAERKAGQLNDMANEANLRQQLAFASNADSIMDQQNLAAMSTLAAHGGKIYIKPSKRGTFTAAAKRRGLGVQEFASKVLANKDRYSSAMVKKANFARNFGGHRKDEGGYKEQAKDILRKQVEGLKSKNSKNPRRVDFTTYSPLYDRSFIPENMSALQDSMINRGYPEPQRYTVLSNILHESGGDPNAVDATGEFRGIAQWSKERYSKDLSFEEQITKLLNESEIPEQPYWSDGGGGKPYIGKLKDGYDKFWSTPHTDSAALYYTKGYIRPAEEKARFNRAREAVNMERYAKAHGGFLTHGGEFSNGITQINNGGLHEQNPMEGVPMGIAPDGLPNLVEEGEVIFNDYVFSNRLRPKEKDLEKMKLKKFKNRTFAQIAKSLQKESEERPNDPISKNGLEDSMAKLTALQEIARAVEGKQGANRLKACGGRKYSGLFNLDDDPQSKVRVYFPPLSEVYNPNGEIVELNPVTVSAQRPSLPSVRGKAETGVPLKDRVRLRPTVPPRLLTEINPVMDTLRTPRPEIRTGQTVAPDIDTYWARQAASRGLPSASRDVTPVFVQSPQRPNIDKDILRSIDEGVVAAQIAAEDLGEVTNPNLNLSSEVKVDRMNVPDNTLPTGLRYAPVVGSLIGSIASAFAKPDYEHSDSLLEAASRQRPSRVRFRPVGNYMRYTPLNTSYMMNRLNAETAGTRRALENMSGGNAAAARNQLTALNRSSQDALGDAFIKAEQYNDNLKRQVEEFNRGTNMFNSQGAMQADSVNAQMQNAYDARRLAAIEQAMRMREASDAALEQSRALNFTNLFDNLGDIGRENFSFNQTRIPGLRYGYTDKDGNTVWLNSYGGILTKRTGKRRRR